MVKYLFFIFLISRSIGLEPKALNSDQGPEASTAKENRGTHF